MSKTKEFTGLLKSEIRKAEKSANEKTNSNDCMVTAISWREVLPMLDYIFIECTIETCHRDGRFASTVKMSIPMFDRRRSEVYEVTDF